MNTCSKFEEDGTKYDHFTVFFFFSYMQRPIQSSQKDISETPSGHEIIVNYNIIFWDTKDVFFSLHLI